MIVYPDLAFLLGALIHGGVLYLALQLCDLPLRKGRYLLAVAVSATGSALYCIPAISVFPLVFVGIVFYAVALQGKRLLGTLRNVITAFVVLIAYCGAYIVISELLFSVSASGFADGIYLLLGFFPCVLSLIFVFLGGACALRVLRHRHGRRGFVTCSLTYGGHYGTFRCLVDSGNLLRDPISGVPVVVVEYDMLRRVFGETLPYPMSCEFSEFFGKNVRMLPVRTVAGDGEMLAGFVPEDFRVNDVPHKAVLAVTPRCLEQRGRFEGVIGIELVRGGACCEPIDTIWKNNSFLEASDL
ncbi:MAG: sigma-E processing peptidase SpoIIGA [Clostridia bacterium]|nr:sigma-E processing peptidase SpoIIGA [Clostridia bacterium]